MIATYQGKIFQERDTGEYYTFHLVDSDKHYVFVSLVNGNRWDDCRKIENMNQFNSLIEGYGMTLADPNDMNVYTDILNNIIKWNQR